MVLRLEKSAGAITCKYPQRGYEVSGKVLVKAIAMVGLVAEPCVRKLVTELRAAHIAG